MQLRVGGIPDDTSEEDLLRLFSAFGAIDSVTVIRGIVTGKSKGYAVIRIPDSQAAVEAISKLAGTTLKGKQITVSRMPDTLPGEMEFREWLADNALEILRKIGLRPGQRVLDYGCGPGVFTIPAATIAGEQGTVYALDVRPQPLERVREKAKAAGLSNVNIILAGNPEIRTGFEDESIDVILVYDMMQQIADKQSFLRELGRVLRQDGFLSVFPMHMGTGKLLETVNESQIFSVRDIYGAPGYRSPSEVVNLVKNS
jgi:SAM-dependent methyltransferase